MKNTTKLIVKVWLVINILISLIQCLLPSASVSHSLGRFSGVCILSIIYILLTSELLKQKRYAWWILIIWQGGIPIIAFMSDIGMIIQYHNQMIKLINLSYIFWTILRLSGIILAITLLIDTPKKWIDIPEHKKEETSSEVQTIYK